MTYHVAYLGPTLPWLHDIIRSEMPAGFELDVLERGDHAEMEQKVANADFVVALKADAALVSCMRHVKLLQYHGVGYHGSIDVAACRKAGIPVAFVPDGNVAEVAEHTILLILAVYRRLIEAHLGLKQGRWLMWQLRPTSYTLEGKTVGIVGLGRIGRATAARLKPFEVEVVYYDVRRLQPSEEQALGVRYLPLLDLAAEADVVTIHVPSVAETIGLIGESFIKRMKSTAVLVNVARGEVVDENALYNALKEGRIAGAGLDVFAHEPLPADSPLIGLDNVVLTPHIASGTVCSLRKKARAWFANFERVVRGETPENLAE